MPVTIMGILYFRATLLPCSLVLADHLRLQDTRTGWDLSAAWQNSSAGQQAAFLSPSISSLQLFQIP